ncbi:hypothetical protein SLE2022_077690 [Rubroshorea leprosula]
MSQPLNLNQGVLILNKCSFHGRRNEKVKLQQYGSFSFVTKNVVPESCYGVHPSFQGSWKRVNLVQSTIGNKAYISNELESEALPHVQTLRRFPKEELFAKVVMVRFDSTILLGDQLDQSSVSVSSALYTIKYLQEAGAKVILISDWSKKINSKLLSTESVADILSSVLQHKVVTVRCISSSIPLKREDLDKGDIHLLENLSENKEEVANCSNFAEFLSSGVDIFVNDSFSQSHKILASTVGICRCCYACMAGFQFEESLHQLKKTAQTNKKPYVAIIGGGNLKTKAAALHFLASRCDALIFIGLLSFQIMHALGQSVPSYFVEHGAHEAALDIIEFAHKKNVPILYPEDLWCRNQHNPKKVEIFPSCGVLDGWVPIDLGPRSLDNIRSVVINSKKIIWIGPMKFRFLNPCSNGASILAEMLCKLGQSGCNITIVGNMACKVMRNQSFGLSSFDMLENASVVWEFFKGRKLPAVVALDRAYPFEVDWNAAYSDPALPLVVDIGSGNGLFIMGMARKRKDLNFLGLEINGKLVRRCKASVHQYDMKNGYFIETNATSTFRSIISSYPGELVLVSIQCPNPDFNKPENRWRMLQRSLIEAVVDLLASNGKVFLQSDVKAVAVTMKEEFLKYGKGKLDLVHDQCNREFSGGMWLEENPFGVHSDWEQHVLERGAPMYRLMLSKLTEK